MKWVRARLNVFPEDAYYALCTTTHLEQTGACQSRNSGLVLVAGGNEGGNADVAAPALKAAVSAAAKGSENGAGGGGGENGESPQKEGVVPPFLQV